jgi:hypothetical protein
VADGSAAGSQAGRQQGSAACEAEASSPDGVTIRCKDDADARAAWYGSRLSDAELEQLRRLDFTVPWRARRVLCMALAAVAEWFSTSGPRFEVRLLLPRGLGGIASGGLVRTVLSFFFFFFLELLQGVRYGPILLWAPPVIH